MFGKARKNSKSSDNNALVRQDPRTKVKTATAQSQTTNTTFESVTIIDEQRNTIINRNTRQTVTHQQTAGVAEICIRRTPTKEELAAITGNGFFQQTIVTQSNGAHRTWSAEQQHVKISHPQPPAWHTQTPPPTSSGTTTKPAPTTYATPKSTTTTIAPLSRDTADTRSLRSTTGYVSPFVRGTSTDAKPLSTTATSQSTSGYVSPFLRSSSAAVKPISATATSQSTSGYVSPFVRGTSTDAKPLSTTATSQSTSGYVSPFVRSSSAGVKPISTTATSQSTSRYVSPFVRGTSTDAKPLSTTATSQSTSGYVSPFLRSSSAAVKPISTTATSQSTSGYVSPFVRGSSTLAYNPTVSPTVPPGNRPPERKMAPTAPITATQTAKNLRPGHAFILNSVNFKGKDRRRDGSDIDAERMCNILKSFKLTVNMYRDPKVREVNDIVKKIKKIDYTNCACLVIVILSHGGKSEMIEAADGHYNIDATILHPILTIPSLKNKPKLFFIQACKGELVPGAFMKDAATVVGEPSEVLKCYSTFEGYVAYRTDNGSLFVDSLYKELELNGRHTDIEKIMKNVTAEVKHRSNSQQVPTLVTTLTKPFTFGDYL